MNPVFTGSITQGKLRLDAPARYMVHLARLEGMLDVVFAVLVGDPTEIELNTDRVLFTYEPSESFQRGYQQAVTGLTLATEMPANLRQFPPNGGRA